MLGKKIVEGILKGNSRIPSGIQPSRIPSSILKGNSRGGRGCK